MPAQLSAETGRHDPSTEVAGRAEQEQDCAQHGHLPVLPPQRGPGSSLFDLLRRVAYVVGLRTRLQHQHVPGGTDRRRRCCPTCCTRWTRSAAGSCLPTSLGSSWPSASVRSRHRVRTAPALRVWVGGKIGYGDVGLNVLLATPGNLLGGLLLMTLTHAVQAKAAR